MHEKYLRLHNIMVDKYIGAKRKYKSHRFCLVESLIISRYNRAALGDEQEEQGVLHV